MASLARATAKRVQPHSGKRSSGKCGKVDRYFQMRLVPASYISSFHGHEVAKELDEVVIHMMDGHYSVTNYMSWWNNLKLSMYFICEETYNTLAK